MFRKPDWFQAWSDANPSQPMGPYWIIGALLTGTIIAVGIILLGNPYQTSTVQTGPRGTAMGVVKIDAYRIADPSIEDYLTEEPYVPEGGELLAKDIYENVQVLGELTEDNFNRVMLAMTQWVAPEEGCAYCHGDVDIENYGNDDLYTKVVSRTMIQMTQNINENYEDHVGGAGVNCYTCHRGEPVPSEIWFNITPVNDNAAGWSANQNRATSISQSTSLPSDALEKYLADYNAIRVHDLESRVDNEGTATIQDTERTFSLMNYFSNSLNVNCTFCHNSRAFYELEESTPQLLQSQLGIGMVQEINLDYLPEIEGILPQERLGSIHGDVPKVGCKTCHKGYSKPLDGTDMISDWPELATTDGVPVYE
jgi:photosynthetic reaction center cytochrome c subunit